MILSLYQRIMGKNKKNKKEIIDDEDSSSFVVNGDAKRSVVAISLFALSILFILGFLSDAKIVDAKIVGVILNKMAGWMFGTVKYISPAVLIIAGIILLLRKETIFYVTKLLGLTISFFGFLGLIHMQYDLSKMLIVAKNGKGGGFIGFFMASIFSKFAGFGGAIVILLALAIIGIIVAFNFSIATFLNKIIIKRSKNEESDENDDLGKETENKIIKNKNNEVENSLDSIDNKIDDDKSSQTENNANEEESVSEINEDDSSVIDNDILEKVVAWTPVELPRPRRTQKKKVFSNKEWELPPIELLDVSIEKAQGGDTKKNAKIIQETLKNFGIDVEPGEIKTGPTVTQYSFRPAVGVKLSRITALSNDLALRLAARQVRIEAPIPGKSLIGIEVPNKTNATIRLPELLESLDFEGKKTNLFLALGKDVSGNYIFGDLKKMPHLLIAGSTGSGKSVCINTILLSMLYQNSPQDLKLILVDPKRVELTPYNGIPHLLADVIVENGKVLSALKWAIGEMERRYKMLQNVGSKDIASFNRKAENGETIKNVNKETGEITEDPIEKIPFIVIVIDELADLMASHGKEVEGAIIRLAQMARAIGIHLILSTQKPMVTVITSLIKSNIPTRIAFRVPSLMDSRTILDSSGAEKLLGNGDMLFSAAEAVDLKRVQGVFVSEEEVKRVVDFIKEQKNIKGEDSLQDDNIIVESTVKRDGLGNGEVVTSYNGEKIDFSSISENDQEDSLYDEAMNIVLQAKKASSSLLQRRLRIGYSRAARLIDMLEENGIISGADGAKPREILVASDGNSAVEYSDAVEDQQIRDKWQM